MTAIHDFCNYLIVIWVAAEFSISALFLSPRKMSSGSATFIDPHRKWAPHGIRVFASLVQRSECALYVQGGKGFVIAWIAYEANVVCSLQFYSTQFRLVINRKHLNNVSVQQNPLNFPTDWSHSVIFYYHNFHVFRHPRYNRTVLFYWYIQ